MLLFIPALSTWSWIGLAVVAFLTWSVYQFIYDYYFHPLSHIPGPPLAFVPGYTLFRIFRGYSVFDLLEAHENYGPVIRFSATGISFADPATEKQIYNSHSFVKDDTYKSYEWGYENSFSTQVPSFSKKRRRMILPVFSAPNVARVEPLVYEVGVRATMNRWIKKYHAAAAAVTATTKTVSETTVGSGLTDANIGEGKGIVKHDSKMDMDLDGSNGAISSQHTITVDLQSSFFEIFYNTIGRLSYGESFRMADGLFNASTKAVDILQLMIETEDSETGEKMSLDELVIESMIQMVAGTDTAGNTLSFTFDYLFANLSVLEKLEAEVLTAFPDPTERITYKAAKEKLPYLEAVLLESVRMRTVGGGYLPRVTPKGGRTIGGYFIPEGTIVGASGYVKHNYSGLWEEPSVFRPERFLEGAPPQVLAERTQLIAPFAVGVRSCAGRQLAITEMIITMAALVQHFEIRPAKLPHKLLNPTFVFVMGPRQKTLYATVKPRHRYRTIPN
ncbi:cytochrome P450 [Ramicandelaber brevisporus]|nr:cytochrome P450 [Ramicandelaber brevisporus]